jgi:hypothetical protein
MQYAYLRLKRFKRLKGLGAVDHSQLAVHSAQLAVSGVIKEKSVPVPKLILTRRGDYTAIGK